jgi:two-component system response regulator HupR/HoxA
VAALAAHDWAGNVRELENEMRRIVVLSQGEVRLEHLSPSVLERRGLRVTVGSGGALESAVDIRSAVADLEKRSIEAALLGAGGNKSRAANELGISRFALQRKLDKYGLDGAKVRSDEGEDEVETQASEHGT